MAIISCGITSSRYYILILGILFNYLVMLNFIKQFIPFDFSFQMLFKGVGMTLGLLFELISRKRRKTDQDEIRKSKETFKKKLLNKIIFIIVCLFKSAYFTFIDFAKFSVDVMKRYFGDEDLPNILMFFIVGLILIFFFKQSFYKHHLFYTIIIIIGMIGKILSNVLFGIKLEADSLVALISSPLIAGEIIAEKWLLDFQFISPFYLVGLVGVFTIIEYFVVVVYYIIFENKNLIETELIIPSVIVVKVIICIVVSCGTNIVDTLIIKEFGPLNRILINFITDFCFVFTGFFDSDLFTNKSLVVCLLITHLIILFGVLGYNEFFVLHACGLDFYTIKSISDRANCSEFQISIVKNEKKDHEIIDW